MRARLLLCSVILSAAAAYSQSPQPQQTPTQHSQVAIPSPAAPDLPENELLKADVDFCKAVQARKLAGWMEFMSEDTVILRDKPYVGLAAIRAGIQDDWRDPGFKLIWTPDAAFISESGKLGNTTGHYVVYLLGPDGKRYRATGQYITVWKKQTDGSWKVAWDGGSPNGQPQLISEAK